jgi:hypothetical protein
MSTGQCSRCRATYGCLCQGPLTATTNGAFLDPHAEVMRLRAALDEANAEVERLREIINRQKVTADERLALKRDRRALRTRRRLIAERDRALTAVQRVEALCDEVDDKDRRQEWHDCAPCLVKTDRVRAALAPQNNGGSE